MGITNRAEKAHASRPIILAFNGVRHFLVSLGVLRTAKYLIISKKFDSTKKQVCKFTEKIRNAHVSIDMAAMVMEGKK